MTLFKSGAAAYAVILAAGLALAIPAGADAATKPNLTGKFDTAASKKAWPHLQDAMTLPMSELVEKASSFEPNYVWAYGLALELGRPAETLSDKQAQRVKAAFQSFLDVYIEKRDGVKLTGDEGALLGMPDFWILLAKTLSRHDPQQAFNAGSTLSTDGGFTAGGSLSFSTQDWDDNEFKAGNYVVQGDAVLNRYLVYASQSCAIYARSFDEMKKVQLIDAASVPYLTAEQLAADKTEAVRIYRTVGQLGPQACGGQEMFDQAAAFADNYLGKLGTYPDDPKATLAPLVADGGTDSASAKP